MVSQIAPLSGEVSTNAENIAANSSTNMSQTADIALLKEQLYDLQDLYGKLMGGYMALLARTDGYDFGNYNTLISTLENNANTLDGQLDDLEADLDTIKQTTIPNLQQEDERLKGVIAGLNNNEEILVGLLPIVTSLNVDANRLTDRYTKLYDENADTFHISYGNVNGYYTTVNNNYGTELSSYNTLNFTPGDDTYPTVMEFNDFINTQGPILAQAQADIATATQQISDQTTELGTYTSTDYFPEVRFTYMETNSGTINYNTASELDADQVLDSWCIEGVDGADEGGWYQDIFAVINENGGDDTTGTDGKKIYSARIEYKVASDSDYTTCAEQQYSTDDSSDIFDKVYSLHCIVEADSSEEKEVRVVANVGGDVGDIVLIPVNGYQLMVTEYVNSPYGSDVYSTSEDGCP